VTRLLVVVVCALTGGIIATSAVGQGTGGSVGTAAVGTKTLEVRVKENAIAFNCVASKPRRCLRMPPRIANLLAGSGAVYDGSTRVGTTGFVNVASKVKRPSLEVFTATILFNNRADSITVMGPASDQGAALPYSIVGGTGAYAGARGTVTEGKETSPAKREIRIPLTLTFIR
jgi:hypothetical protein